MIRTLALTILTGCIASSLPAQTDSNFQVRAIRALLFYQDSGTLSSFDAMAEGSDAPALWNTIIGEGSADHHPSAATLVLVRVRGPFSVAGKKPMLHITASQEIRQGTRSVLDRQIKLGPFFTETGEAWIPVIIYDTGCGAVKVTAVLGTGRRNGGLTKTIPFECGE